MPQPPFRPAPAWLGLLAVLAVPTAAARAGGEEPVSFVREVLPVLTRQGCNAGSCHGSPSGKNGFRLSLRGYDPALDIATLTREAAGRRPHRLAPEASLILLKGTARIPHEGGRRLEPGDAAYTLLPRWVAQGGHDHPAAPPRPGRPDPAPSARTLRHAA